MDDIELAKSLFPPEPMEGSLWSQAQGSMVREVAELLKPVVTWPDLLSMPDEALGLDPFYGATNAALVIYRLNSDDVVRFLPGWLLLARDRSFSLGVMSTMIAALHPNGVMAQVTNDDGRSELETLVDGMNLPQRHWVAAIFKQILDGCRGVFADKAQTVAECVAFWEAASVKEFNR
jgi:hypothetical protein